MFTVVYLCYITPTYTENAPYLAEHVSQAPQNRHCIHIKHIHLSADYIQDYKTYTNKNDCRILHD